MGFEDLQNDSNNILILRFEQCQISQTCYYNYNLLFYPFPVGQKDIFSSKAFGSFSPLPCEICVPVKLFTTLKSSTLGKCYLKEDTILSGGALGSQQGAQHFSNTTERPSHMRETISSPHQEGR